MSKPAGFGRPVTVFLLVLLGMVAPLTATGAAQSEDEGLISETEYESPQFGYAVEWEETWEAQEEGTESSEEGGYDLLTLSSGPAVFQIYAAEAGGATAEEEVERLIESYGDDYDDFETIDKGGDDELAAAIVDYDLEGTLVRDLTEVRLVDDGDTLLTVVVFAPVDDFEDAVDDAQESITLDRDPPFSTLDLVDISATTSTETDTQTETATETET